MVTAVYPGTFDPVTNGHIDIILRANKLFDQLIIAIASNNAKNPWFNLQQRIKMVEQVLRENHVLNKVKVIGFDCLLVEFCKQYQAGVILRGLRAVSDFEYEFQLSGMNKQLDAKIETLFLPTSEQHSYISSSLVKEVARLNGNIENIVPHHVKAELLKKIV